MKIESSILLQLSAATTKKTKTQHQHTTHNSPRHQKKQATEKQRKKTPPKKVTVRVTYLLSLFVILMPEVFQQRLTLTDLFDESVMEHFVLLLLSPFRSSFLLLFSRLKLTYFSLYTIYYCHRVKIFE